jgi:S-adenosylmethionine decarboxylase
MMKLHGFNNLTKSLSFNMYDICYTTSASEREAYIAYIDEVYNADRLTSILKNVADMIGAHILNVAKQDYVPQGASVTMLISEEPIEVPKEQPPVPQAVVCALDKSHITRKRKKAPVFRQGDELRIFFDKFIRCVYFIYCLWYI